MERPQPNSEPLSSASVPGLATTSVRVQPIPWTGATLVAPAQPGQTGLQYYMLSPTPSRPPGTALPRLAPATSAKVKNEVVVIPGPLPVSSNGGLSQVRGPHAAKSTGSPYYTPSQPVGNPRKINEEHTGLNDTVASAGGQLGTHVEPSGPSHTRAVKIISSANRTRSPIKQEYRVERIRVSPKYAGTSSSSAPPQPKTRPKQPPKKRKPRKRKNQREQEAEKSKFRSEMNEMKSKIQNRYDSKRKPTIKKEEVGYDGPYIKSYRIPGDKGKIPIPNYVVDNLEAHVTPTETNKQRLKLDKPIGINTDAPLVCAFCHLDPAAERQTAMGDLIGPILVPMEVRWQRKPNEDKVYVYIHSKCLEWSSNFRMIGFEMADARAVFEDSKNNCHICNRRGATIGCSGPRCNKTFHYPCVVLQGCRSIQASHQVFCDEHKNVVRKNGSILRVPVKAPEDEEMST